MSNRFLFPTTERDAQRIVDARKKAIRRMEQGLGFQNELTAESHPSAIAAYRILEGVSTTEAERKSALIYAIAHGYLMATISLTERARHLAKQRQT